MYLILAIFAGIVVAVLTVSAVTTVIAVRNERKRAIKDERHSWENEVFQMLIHWTRFDYALLFVFVIGGLFLFTDLLAVIRDQALFPYYHYGYLASGFCYVLISMILMQLRLAYMLKLLRMRHFIAPNEHDEPHQANRTE